MGFFRRVTLSLWIVFSARAAYAEPWMASRFADNCAACHAPGRVDVALKSKRCSFSCKSCHTSPSGGGLRNVYGKWNEQRWLNSSYFKGYMLNKPHPAPLKDQAYAAEKWKSYDSDKKKAAAQKGLKLVVKPGFPDEKLYAREFTEVKPDEGEPDLLLASIPESDPWSQAGQRKFNLGTDTRLSYLSDDNKAQDTTSNSSSKVKRSGYLFLTDLEGSVQPLHRVTLVVGGRFLNGPGRLAWDGGTKKSEWELRSLYGLLDDLPYNSFAQYGVYRPLFGIGSADRDSLLNIASGLDQRANFTTFSVGTQPGIPFINLHYVAPMNDSAFAQDKGFVFNIGARFRKMGSYLMLSYWNTSAVDRVTLVSDKKEMTALTGGLTYQRYTLTADATRLTLLDGAVRKDSGVVITLDNRLRVYRENYLKLIYETLNTALDLREGKSSSVEVGAESFVVSSVAVSLSYRSLTETTPTLSYNDKTTMAQMHFYY